MAKVKIRCCEKDPERITTQFKRPSEEMAHFGDEVHKRLVEFEEHDYTRKGYNVEGAVVDARRVCVNGKRTSEGRQRLAC